MTELPKRRLSFVVSSSMNGNKRTCPSSHITDNTWRNLSVLNFKAHFTHHIFLTAPTTFIYMKLACGSVCS